MSKIIEKIVEAGIVGAGGAGFPTHVKFNGDIETLVINAVECEPLLQVDKSLMKEYTSELIEVLTTLCDELKIKSVIIGVKNKYEEIINKLNYYADHDQRIKVHPLPNVYPMGDEVVLIRETTGITLKRGELPVAYKVMVINVETLLNVYSKIFANKNVTHSYVTIAGEVENAGTYNYPIGTSLEWILNNMCKPKIEKYKVIVGGPMTGSTAKIGEVVKKNTKAFIVLKADHHLIRTMDDVNEVHLKRIMSSCSQCRACTDMCPRHLLGHQVEPHKLMNAMANGLTNNVGALKTALGCVDCGVCELYACHHDLSPRKMMMAVKMAYAKEGIRANAEGCIEPHEDRDFRRVPTKRLVMHLNLTQYDITLPYDLSAVKVKEVRIPLQQHIGAPSKACVAIGETVRENQLIATMPEGKLGCNMHASIDGLVTEITNEYIKIVEK